MARPLKPAGGGGVWEAVITIAIQSIHSMCNIDEAKYKWSANTCT